jgi:anti-sigma B factor antagonist
MTSKKGPLMSLDFKQIRVTTLNDVVVIEILSTDVQGPERATEFSKELCAVASEESTLPILLDMRRCRYLSSMAYSALFKLVKQANERQRSVKFCNMHPDVKVGADIVGVYHVVEICDCRESALAALAEESAAVD